MDELNVIVVGAGTAGEKFHINSYNALTHTKLIAVCDPNEEHLRAVAKEKKIPYYYSTLEEALAKHRADLVSICSPPQFHLAQARLALEAGANVLLEKPMVTSISEADELAGCIKNTGRKLCVVHNGKFTESGRALFEKVREGIIGDVLHLDITNRRIGRSDRMIKDPNCWVHALPGGRWEETLPHDLYMAYEIVGEMELKSVYGRKVSGNWPYLLADEVSMTFQCSKGYVNILFSANVEKNQGRLFVIHGTRGILAVKGGSMFMPGYNLRLNLLARFSSKGKKVISRVSKKVLGKRTRKADPLEYPRESGHLSLIEQYVLHLWGKGPMPVDWEEAYLTFTLTEKAGLALQAAVKDASKLLL